ncbi:MAG TPA: DbpA RNA binding domain-containing protein [Chloroflexia bacterium]|nr:DbpA RNA binding domain-containing protein [Chloroflexia bacterium]
MQPNEIRWLRAIERIIGQKITPMRLPSLLDVEARRRELMKTSIREKIAAGNLLPFMQLVTELAEEFDLAEIAAAAAKMASDGERPLTEMVEPAQARTISDGVERGMARLVLNVGREAGVRPGDIVGAIANEAGIPGRTIGAIDIYDRVTFVEVPEGDKDRVVNALRTTTIKGRKLQVEATDAAEGNPPRRQTRTAQPYERQRPDRFARGRLGKATGKATSPTAKPSRWAKGSARPKPRRQSD